MTERQKTANPSGQEGLVKLLLKTGPEKHKVIIPGGKTLVAQIGQHEMKNAVYNWIRRYSIWDEMILSWAKEPDKWQPVVKKIQTFALVEGKAFWQSEAHGRAKLADKIAQIINSQRFVFLQVKPDGMYLGESKTDAFRHKVKLTAEMKSSPEYAEYADAEIGTEVISAHWEPYLEFLVPRTTRYDKFARK